MIIKPFKGFRPKPDLAPLVALNPNNLLNEPQRREEAKNNPYSFAHVVKPRIDFPSGALKNETELFNHACNYFDKLSADGILIRDPAPCFYIYRLSMEGHSQTGLICCLHIKDYQEGRIKKHEHTRADKENENLLHIRHTRLNSNPVFLTYEPVKDIDELVSAVTSANIPDYKFLSENGVSQQVWVVSDEGTLKQLTTLFDDKVPCSYIADGHHRAAAASLYANEVKNNERTSKLEDYNYLLTALFPSDQLHIFEYNRLVKNLNGLTEKEFLKKVAEKFEVKEATRSPYDPTKPHRFGMFLNDKWYKLKAREGTYTNDPVGQLDVTILQNNLLDPILGIKDPRIDKRIDFIPGVKGFSALENPVLKRKAMVAFSLYPVTMDQLFAISDMGEVMPPKSTWFEPKLMSGLIIFRMEV